MVIRSAALASLLLLAPADPDFLNLADAAPGRLPPPGWKVRPVSGQQAPDLTIAESPGGRTLRLTGAGRAAWVVAEIAPRFEERPGRLEFVWRVDAAPPAANLSRKDLDDSPIRVFVAFGRLGGLFPSGRAIFYSWAGGEAPGYQASSFASDRLHVVSLAGSGAIGSWRTESVDPFEDYRRIWGKEPPAMTAVGLMQDTDQTGDSADASIRSLRWTAVPPGGP